MRTIARLLLAALLLGAGATMFWLHSEPYAVMGPLFGVDDARRETALGTGVGVIHVALAGALALSVLLPSRPLRRVVLWMSVVWMLAGLFIWVLMTFDAFGEWSRGGEDLDLLLVPLGLLLTYAFGGVLAFFADDGEPDPLSQVP
jgi:hypothetical protein